MSILLHPHTRIFLQLPTVPEPDYVEGSEDNAPILGLSPMSVLSTEQKNRVKLVETHMRKLAVEIQAGGGELP